MDTVNESITTVDDGEGTVNERLSPGGPGPEGQADTATESLSGQDPVEVAEATDEAKPAKKTTAKAK